MVKQASHGIKQYDAKLDPIVLLLQMKARMRNMQAGTNSPLKDKVAIGYTINALKDTAVKSIIDAHVHTVRDKVNAWNAFRELYYGNFQFKQKVQHIGS